MSKVLSHGVAVLAVGAFCAGAFAQSFGSVSEKEAFIAAQEKAQQAAQLQVKQSRLEASAGKGGPSVAGPVPANDECVDRIVIVDGLTSFDTTGATDGDVNPACGSTTFNDIWFNYVATCSGNLTVTTCEQLGGSASYDSRIAIHDGTGCSPAGASLGCNDDDLANPCGSSAGGFHSTAVAAVSAGQAVKIRVGGFSSDVGAGQINVSCAGPGVCGDGSLDLGEECDDGNLINGDGCSDLCEIEPPPPPANDECADRIVIGDGLTSFTTVDALTDGPGGIDCAPNGQGSGGLGQLNNDVWFNYTATCTGNLTVSTCEEVGGSATFDSKIAIHDGTSCSGLAGSVLTCNDDDTGNPCGGGGGGFHSTAITGVTVGNVYKIRVGGFGTTTEGSGSLFVGCEEPPSNEVCEGRILIGDGLTSFSTVGSTTDGPEYSPAAICESLGAPDGTVHNDIWFNYVASCSGLVTITTCEELGGSATYDSKLALHDGTSCSGLVDSVIACNDDDLVNPCGSVNFHSTLQASVTAGNAYKIRVGGFTTTSNGTGVLNVTCSTCGDGVLDPGEECDDGNFVSGDGCSATCTREIITEFLVDKGSITVDWSQLLSEPDDTTVETIDLVRDGLMSLSYLAGPYSNGETIDATLNDFELVGNSVALGGEIRVRQSGTDASVGTVSNIVADGNGDLTSGDASIDVFFEIEVVDGAFGGTVAANNDILTVSTTIGSLPPVPAIFTFAGVVPVFVLEADCSPGGNLNDVTDTQDIAIPDGGPGAGPADCIDDLDCPIGSVCLVVDGVNACGIRTEMFVADDGSLIADLNVDLLVTHTFRNDLIIDLTHKPSGTTVRLADQPDGGSNNIGDPGAGTPVIFDDDAALPYNTQTGDNLVGTFQPFEALAGFNGRPKGGTWSLTITDNFGADTGTLNQWSLHFCKAQKVKVAQVEQVTHQINPCVKDCVPGHIAEGEPECTDNYVDAYNGGCNSLCGCDADLNGDTVVDATDSAAAAACVGMTTGDPGCANADVNCDLLLTQADADIVACIEGGGDAASCDCTVVDVAPVLAVACGDAYCGQAGTFVTSDEPVESCVTADDCIDSLVCTLDECVDGACTHTEGIYGDLATAANQCGQDNDVGLFDLFAMLDAFSGTGVCTDGQADIAGQPPAPQCEPDNDIGLFDIIAMLDAFGGNPGCPCPTPGPTPDPVDTRDTDWYQLDLTGPAFVTYSVIADGPVQVIVAQADCDNGFLIAANSAPAADCGEVVFEGCLATGSYYFIVAPFNFTGEDCPGLTYNAELTCGTCVSPFCGDGNVDAGEECDDGNGLGGDGCDVFCQNEPFCGDGTVDPGETCDDGNVTPGDGCDENCQLEPICDPLKTPENEPDCGAVFSGGPDTVNGGCNSAPPVYSPIACGDEICGTMGQDATGFGLRDTDWYELIVTGATQITLDVTSQFNSVFGVVNTGGSGNCADATAIDPVAFGTPNTPASMSTILGPGTWWLFVSTVDVVDIPCGAEYTMSLTCAPPPAPPVNDDCADRIAIGDGATSYSTLLATTDGPAIDCAPNGVGDVHNDIWFNYTASCTGVLAVTTCEELGGSANFDTKIAIHDGTDCSDTAASLIACNDDDPVNPCGGGGGGFHSTVTAAVTSGNVYKIRLGAFSAAQFGGGVLNISCGSVCGNGALEAGEECDDGNLINGDGCSDLCEIEPPANDNCADRTAIGDGVTSFTTLEATTDGPDYTPAADCGAFGDDSIGNDIWFNYVATCTGTLTATTCEELGGSADFDTRIAIHDGTACSGLLGTVLVCNDDDPVNACGTGGGGFHSTATAAVTSGQIYKIRLGGFSDFDSGSGGLLIGCAAGPSPTPPASTPAAHRASAKSVDAVQLSLVPSQRTAQAGSLISVDVFASGLTGARGYQIALDVAADRLAQAELVGIEINQAHSSYAFGNHEAYGAVDLEKGRAANALVSGFAKSAGQVYLATFTYRVLPGSTGALAFVIDESDTFVAGGHSAVAPLKSGGARVVITQPAKGR